MAVDKKLAKKLAKMSEEERAVFLEQQRLADEENQRKKEEMLSRFLKVRLEKGNTFDCMIIRHTAYSNSDTGVYNTVSN